MYLDHHMTVFRGERELSLSITGIFLMKKPNSTRPGLEDPAILEIHAYTSDNEEIVLTPDEQTRAEEILWDVAADQLCKGAS